LLPARGTPLRDPAGRKRFPPGLPLKPGPENSS